MSEASSDDEVFFDCESAPTAQYSSIKQMLELAAGFIANHGCSPSDAQANQLESRTTPASDTDEQAASLEGERLAVSYLAVR